MAKGRAARVSKWAGMVLLWVLLLLYFSYLLFPYESVRAVVEEKLDAVPSVKVSFDGLGPSGALGLDLEGVKISWPLASAESPVFVADTLTVRPLFLPLVLGRRSAGFKADAYGGEIETKFVVGKDRTRVVLSVDGVDLGSYGFLSTALGRPIQGNLDSEVDLKLEGGRLSVSDGTVSVSVSDGEFQPLPSKTEKGPPPMRVKVKRLKVRLEVEKGKATVKLFTFEGPDIEGNADGTITLSDRPEASQLNGDLRFRFVSEEMKGNVGPLLEAALRLKKNADGYYQIKLRGTIAHPSL